jgi:hypothetical protein
MSDGCGDVALYAVRNELSADVPDEAEVVALAHEVGITIEDARQTKAKWQAEIAPRSVCYGHVAEAVDHFMHDGNFPILIELLDPRTEEKE